MVARHSHFGFLLARLKSRSIGFAVRLLDIVAALVVLLLLLPLWTLHFFVARLQGQPWLVFEPVVGIGGKTISLPVARLLERGPFKGFFNKDIIRRSPVFLAVFYGDMSIVGPAPVPEAERDSLQSRHLRRFDAKPGVIHSHFLRTSANIAFEDERELALDDTENTRVKSRLGMIARAIPALFFRSKEQGEAAPPFLDMFGLKMTNKTLDDALDDIIDLARSDRRERIAFVNPDCINISLKNPEYRQILDDSDHIYPDGIGLQIACKMLKLQMKDNLNGTDLFPALCNKIEDTEIGLYLFGAQPGVVDAMVEKLYEKYPKLKIRGYRHGFIEKNQLTEVINEINDSGAQILLVAMGVPRQEKWIDNVWSDLNVNLAMGVGGLFDFTSGRIPRAPLWMREMGLEWAFRLFKEPRRLWKRYIIGNLVFLWNVVRFGK